jgi:hypothetical protein
MTGRIFKLTVNVGFSTALEAGSGVSRTTCSSAMALPARSAVAQSAAALRRIAGDVVTEISERVGVVDGRRRQMSVKIEVGDFISCV